MLNKCVAIIRANSGGRESSDVVRAVDWCHPLQVGHGRVVHEVHSQHDQYMHYIVWVKAQVKMPGKPFLRYVYCSDDATDQRHEILWE